MGITFMGNPLTLEGNKINVGDKAPDFRVLDNDLNFFSVFIQKFSQEMPLFYSLFTIMFAIFLGVAAAFIRRFFSDLRKKHFNKAA